MFEEGQEMAFRTLKNRLLSQPILQYLDITREFIPNTDASNDDARAVLSQGQIGKDLPIPNASRSFNKAEGNYSRVEKGISCHCMGH